MDELFKGRHFDREIIVLCVRWYLRHKLSFRDLVEMMAERGLSLAHTTIMRWIQHYAPNSRNAGTASLGQLDGPGASTRPTSKSKDAGPISTVPSTKREESSTSCCAPSGTSPRPKPSSGLLSGVRADCRLKSRSTVIRPHIAQPKSPGRTSRGKSMQDQIVKIFEQFDRTGSSIRQASARSDARPQAFPPSRNDDRRHRTHASDPEGLFKLGRLGAKGNTAPKIWN